MFVELIINIKDNQIVNNNPTLEKRIVCFSLGILPVNTGYISPTKIVVAAIESESPEDIVAANPATSRNAPIQNGKTSVIIYGNAKAVSVISGFNILADKPIIVGIAANNTATIPEIMKLFFTTLVFFAE